MAYKENISPQNKKSPKSHICEETREGCQKLKGEVQVASLFDWGVEQKKIPPYSPQEIIKEFSQKNRLVDFNITHKSGSTFVYKSPKYQKSITFKISKIPTLDGRITIQVGRSSINFEAIDLETLLFNLSKKLDKELGVYRIGKNLDKMKKYLGRSFDINQEENRLSFRVLGEEFVFHIKNLAVLTSKNLTGKSLGMIHEKSDGTRIPLIFIFGRRGKIVQVVTKGQVFKNSPNKWKLEVAKIIHKSKRKHRTSTQNDDDFLSSIWKKFSKGSDYISNSIGENIDYYNSYSTENHIIPHLLGGEKIFRRLPKSLRERAQKNWGKIFLLMSNSFKKYWRDPKDKEKREFKINSEDLRNFLDFVEQKIVIRKGKGIFSKSYKFDKDYSYLRMTDGIFFNIWEGKNHKINIAVEGLLLPNSLEFDNFREFFDTLRRSRK